MRIDGKKIFKLAGLAMAVSVLFVSTSCDKEPVGNRPVLPPVESLKMDYSDFNAAIGDKKASVASYVNFNHAFASLVFWSGVSAASTALPVAAYGYALEQEAEYLGDNSWEWSYDFEWNQVNYTATLTATRISNEEFSVEMLIGLAVMPGEGVRWFDGVVRYDHTHASWTIYREGDIEKLDIEWTCDFEQDDASLQYTYVEPDMNETGSFILYEYASQELYDASFSVSLSSGSTLIEWDTTSREGRVQDETKFGDALWHCWDSLENGLADKSCE
jgi:hypothetical protein